MTMGRLKHLHLIVMLGISLFMPLFLAHSLYVALSATVLLSYDMVSEDSEDEDLSTCRNEFKVFIPTVTSNLLLSVADLRGESDLFSPPLKSYTQIMPILRC